MGAKLIMSGLLHICICCQQQRSSSTIISMIRDVCLISKGITLNDKSICRLSPSIYNRNKQHFSSTLVFVIATLCNKNVSINTISTFAHEQLKKLKLSIMLSGFNRSKLCRLDILFLSWGGTSTHMSVNRFLTTMKRYF